MLTFEQRRQLEDELKKKYFQAQDESDIDEASESARQTDLLAGLAKAADTLVRAKSVSRGGTQSDPSAFQHIRDQGRSAIQRAVEARRNRIEGVAGEAEALDRQGALAEKEQVAQRQQMQDAAAAEQRSLENTRESKLMSLKEQELRDRKEAEELQRSFKGLEQQSKQSEQGRKESLDLTKEYMNHPTTKATNIVTGSYDKIKALATDTEKFTTGAGDMGMVFSYMKMLDPASTVREGEYANAQNSGGVGERIRNVYNSVAEGKILTPQQRLDFLRSANTLKNSQLESQKKVKEEFSGVAKRYGLDPEQAFGGDIDSPATSSSFPKQVRHSDGRIATVSDEQELKEALSEGFK